MKRMRLKYYMRALGIGILVTALLMGYGQKDQAQMTDEEILQRAAELEREKQEGTSLADIATASPQPTEVPAAQSTQTPAAPPTMAPATEPTATPTAKPTATPTTEPTVTPTATPMATPAGDTVTLVINRGESSITVSKNLQELGLIDDYKAYDRFLCDNGYDHSISTGTYEIPVDATYEEIARIISKKR